MDLLSNPDDDLVHAISELSILRPIAPVRGQIVTDEANLTLSLRCEKATVGSYWKLEQCSRTQGNATKRRSGAATAKQVWMLDRFRQRSDTRAVDLTGTSAGRSLWPMPSGVFGCDRWAEVVSSHAPNRCRTCNPLTSGISQVRAHTQPFTHFGRRS